jgi:ATP phosphoribosyltransferase
MSSRLRIALTKGRLQEQSVELFEAMGLDCAPIRNPGPGFPRIPNIR